MSNVLNELQVSSSHIWPCSKYLFNIIVEFGYSFNSAEITIQIACYLSYQHRVHLAINLMPSPITLNILISKLLLAIHIKRCKLFAK